MRLLELASLARLNAYAPYSGYAVGAAVRGAGGGEWAGCNVENVSFGATICAERVALMKMVSEGERVLSAVALVTHDGGAPCGVCLQVMAEFAPDPTKVVVRVHAAETGDTREYVLSELLPHAFTTKLARV